MKVKSGDFLRVARHEVAHHLLSNRAEPDHFTIRASRADRTSVGLKQVQLFADLPSQKRIQREVTRNVRESGDISPSVRRASNLKHRNILTQDLVPGRTRRGSGAGIRPGKPTAPGGRTVERQRAVAKVGSINRLIPKDVEHPRFEGKQNRKVRVNPRSSTSTVSRSKEQARKSGIRVKRKGIDF